MQSGIAESALSYPSKDGSTTIRARLWAPAAPDGAPVASRAIVQIVHGMCEHMGRYDEFARFLARNGFAVCGEDHIGHGESASDPAEFGHMPPREGKDILIADVCALRRLMRERFGEGVPYFLFGHSMGSFIVRAYLARPCARNLSGAVICGTGEQPRALSAAGNLLARIIGRVAGERHRSALIDGLGAGAYGKRIPDARTPFDWLSTDPAVVDAYLADERCGFMFTVGGYAALTDLAGAARRRGGASRRSAVSRHAPRDPQRARPRPGDVRHPGVARRPPRATVPHRAGALRERKLTCPLPMS